MAYQPRYVTDGEGQDVQVKNEEELPTLRRIVEQSAANLLLRRPVFRRKSDTFRTRTAFTRRFQRHDDDLEGVLTLLDRWDCASMGMWYIDGWYKYSNVLARYVLIASDFN